MDVLPIIVVEITIAAIPPPSYTLQTEIPRRCARGAHCTIQKDGQALVHDLNPTHEKSRCMMSRCFDTHDISKEQDLRNPHIGKNNALQSVDLAHHEQPVATLVE